MSERTFRWWGREYVLDLPDDEFHDVINSAMLYGASGHASFEECLDRRIGRDSYRVVGPAEAAL